MADQARDRVGRRAAAALVRRQRGGAAYSSPWLVARERARQPDRRNTPAEWLRRSVPAVGSWHLPPTPRRAHGGSAVRPLSYAYRWTAQQTVLFAGVQPCCKTGKAP